MTSRETQIKRKLCCEIGMLGLVAFAIIICAIVVEDYNKVDRLPKGSCSTVFHNIPNVDGDPPSVEIPNIFVVVFPGVESHYMTLSYPPPSTGFFPVTKKMAEEWRKKVTDRWYINCNYNLKEGKAWTQSVSNSNLNFAIVGLVVCCIGLLMCCPGVCDTHDEFQKIRNEHALLSEAINPDVAEASVAVNVEASV